MINPAELVDALVEKLRAIPELVLEMEGDPQRICAYHDLYPKRVSLPLAIYEMPVPSILVAWQGTTPGSFGAAIRGRMEFGDREASLKFTARFEHGSTELTKLRNQTTGTAVVGLQGDLISGSDYHSLEVTFHKVAFRTAVVGDTDGIVTIEVECTPLRDATNDLLTAVAKTSQDNIG